MNLIVIPTYDERASIGVLLEELLGLDWSGSAGGTHVLVVDDSSPDGTADVVRAHPAYGSVVFLLSRTVKDGLGAAYRAGFAWALEHGYATVVQMDADGSHPADAVPRLLRALQEGAEVVIGSRYVPGGRTQGWSWHRRLISAGGNAYVRTVLGTPVRDATAGFRAFRSSALARLVGTTHANGYCFQVETTWRASRLGLRIVEVPITFVDRRAGESKMGPGIVVEALWRVLTWRVEEAVDEVGTRRARRESDSGDRQRHLERRARQGTG